MHTPRRRKNNLWHALAGDSGLTSIQWVGLSAVALVTIAVILGVFAAGGSQEIQQAASTGTDRRIDCLYNNCQPWQNDSSGPKAGAAAQASGGASLQTAGDITAEAASDGASLKSDAASMWDRFWKGAGTLFGKTVQFGKNLLGKLGDFAGDVARFGKDLAGKLGDLAGKAWDGLKSWWNGLPNWAKGLIVGLPALILLAVLLIAGVGLAPWLIVGLVVFALGTSLYGVLIGPEGQFHILEALKWGLLAGLAAAVMVAGGWAGVIPKLVDVAVTMAIKVGVSLLLGQELDGASLLQDALLSIIFFGALWNLQHWQTAGRYADDVLKPLKQLGSWLRRAEEGGYAPGSATHDVLSQGKGWLWPTMTYGAKWLFKMAEYGLFTVPETVMGGLLERKDWADIVRQLGFEWMGANAKMAAPDSEVLDKAIDADLEFIDQGWPSNASNSGFSPLPVTTTRTTTPATRPTPGPTPTPTTANPTASPRGVNVTRPTQRPRP